MGTTYRTEAIFTDYSEDQLVDLKHGLSDLFNFGVKLKVFEIEDLPKLIELSPSGYIQPQSIEEFINEHIQVYYNSNFISVNIHSYSCIFYELWEEISIQYNLSITVIDIGYYRGTCHINILDKGANVGAGVGFQGVLAAFVYMLIKEGYPVSFSQIIKELVAENQISEQDHCGEFYISEDNFDFDPPSVDTWNDLKEMESYIKILIQHYFENLKYDRTLIYERLINTFSILIKDYIFDSEDLNAAEIVSVDNDIMNSLVGHSEIKEWAFEESNIDQLIIPNEVEHIGKCAFYASTIKSITLHENFKSIGERAFESCGNLSHINIPNSIESLGNLAFKHCKKLTRISIPESILHVSAGLFYDCMRLKEVLLPMRLLSIDRMAFNNCKSLIHIDFPEGLLKIGVDAFHSCEKLKSIDLPMSLKNIDHGAFGNCKSITKIVLPNSIKEIASFTFTDCIKLKEIIFSEELQSISNGAFQNCSSLSKIHLPKGLKTIAGWTFTDCEKLSSIIIPEGVKKIGQGAIDNCTSLTDISLPAGLLSIEPEAFKGCTSLVKIKIPESLTNIGSSAFADCISLMDIVLPVNLENIGEDIFLGCDNLEL